MANRNEVVARSLPIVRPPCHLIVEPRDPNETITEKKHPIGETENDLVKTMLAQYETSKRKYITEVTSDVSIIELSDRRRRYMFFEIHLDQCNQGHPPNLAKKEAEKRLREKDKENPFYEAIFSPLKGVLLACRVVLHPDTHGRYCHLSPSDMERIQQQLDMALQAYDLTSLYQLVEKIKHSLKTEELEDKPKLITSLENSKNSFAKSAIIGTIIFKTSSDKISQQLRKEIKIKKGLLVDQLAIFCSKQETGRVSDPTTAFALLSILETLSDQNQTAIYLARNNGGRSHIQFPTPPHLLFKDDELLSPEKLETWPTIHMEIEKIEAKIMSISWMYLPEDVAILLYGTDYHKLKPFTVSTGNNTTVAVKKTEIYYDLASTHLSNNQPRPLWNNPKEITASSISIN